MLQVGCSSCWCAGLQVMISMQLLGLSLKLATASLNLLSRRFCTAAAESLDLHKVPSQVVNHRALCPGYAS